MTSYKCSLERVINGCTVEMNVVINAEQTEKHIIRLKGVSSGNLQKTFHLSFRGGERTVQELRVKEWFYERTEELTVEFDIIDICGRWLGVITGDISGDNLNDDLIDLGYKNDEWDKDYQEELIDDWYSGEEVTIPEGDKLPIFHIWGKLNFVGPYSNQLRRLE